MLKKYNDDIYSARFVINLKVYFNQTTLIERSMNRYFLNIAEYAGKQIICFDMLIYNKHTYCTL